MMIFLMMLMCIVWGFVVFDFVRFLFPSRWAQYIFGLIFAVVGWIVMMFVIRFGTEWVWKIIGG